MQNIERQPGYEEADMPTENENTDTIQNSAAAKRGVKESKKSCMDSQNLHLTPGEVNQPQDITHTHMQMMSNTDLLQVQKTLICGKNYYMRK